MDAAGAMPLTVRSCSRNLLVFTGIFTFLVSSPVEPRLPWQSRTLRYAVRNAWGRMKGWG